MKLVLTLSLCILLALSKNACSELITQSTSFQIVDLGAAVKPKAINNLGAVVGQGADGQAFLW